MKSKLSKAEFKKRLIKLTSKEKDFYLFTPYNSSGTPFCGKYDDKTFELTRNSFWRHVKAIIIKGEYKESNNNSTEVIYTISWTKFMRALSVIFLGLTFIGINTVLIVMSKNSNHSLTSLLAINGFIAFGCLWVMIINQITKRIINQRFKKEFEIEVIDEWETLAVNNTNGYTH